MAASSDTTSSSGESAPAAEKARTFFESIWAQGDYWSLETSPFERDKYERQLARIGDRNYQKVLEIGCGAGVFTRAIASLACQVIAVDVAPAAIERARTEGDANGVIEYRVADVI